MEQFTEELGLGVGGLNGSDFDGMPDLGNTALDDMFRKMMVTESATSDCGANTPRSSSSKSQNDRKQQCRNTNTSSHPSASSATT